MKFVKILMSAFCVLALTLSMNAAPVLAETVLSHAPESATASILEPSNNSKVKQTFTVQFGLSGMGVAPAGVDVENTGHHHLLVDLDELPALDAPLPKTEHVMHFGKGQTETQLTLPPGKHTLQLLLGNYQHIPHDHPVTSKKITVNVS